MLKFISAKCSNGVVYICIGGIIKLALHSGQDTCGPMPIFYQPRNIYQPHHYIGCREWGINNKVPILSYAKCNALVCPVDSRITPCGCGPWIDTWVRHFGQSHPIAMLTLLTRHKLKSNDRRISLIEPAPCNTLQRWIYFCVAKLTLSKRSNSHKLNQRFNRWLAVDTKMNEIFAERRHS